VEDLKCDERQNVRVLAADSWNRSRSPPLSSAASIEAFQGWKGDKPVITMKRLDRQPDESHEPDSWGPADALVRRASSVTYDSIWASQTRQGTVDDWPFGTLSKVDLEHKTRFISRAFRKYISKKVGIM
jgi:hypothetical protein